MAKGVQARLGPTVGVRGIQKEYGFWAGCQGVSKQAWAQRKRLPVNVSPEGPASSLPCTPLVGANSIQSLEWIYLSAALQHLGTFYCLVIHSYQHVLIPTLPSPQMSL